MYSPYRVQYSSSNNTIHCIYVHYHICKLVYANEVSVCIDLLCIINNDYDTTSLHIPVLSILLS